MARARSDITDIEERITAIVEAFRPVGRELDEAAWAELETFVAIAFRVLRKTNPSKIRDAAMTEEIKARLHGKEVLE